MVNNIHIESDELYTQRRDGEVVTPIVWSFQGDTNGVNTTYILGDHTNASVREQTELVTKAVLNKYFNELYQSTAIEQMELKINELTQKVEEHTSEEKLNEISSNLEQLQETNKAVSLAITSLSNVIFEQKGKENESVSEA